MPRFRNVRLSSIAVLTVVLPAMGQSPADAGPPTAEAIVERFIDATGGRAAWESLTSIRGLGTIEVVGVPVRGSVAIYQTAEGFRRSVDADGVGVQATIRRGAEAWNVRGDGLVTAMEGAELLKMQRDNSFNPLLDPSQIYASLAVNGVEEVVGAQAWVVRCVPENDPEAEDLRYFDMESGLQVKLVQRGSGQGAAIPTEIFLSDYRPVGEVQFAFETMIVAGRGRIQISLQAMQSNVSIPSCLFETPDGNIIKPSAEQPRQVLEAFMKVDVNALTASQVEKWIERLDDAHRRIPKGSPQAEAMGNVLRECRRACHMRLQKIEEAGDGAKEEQPSGGEHPTGADHPS